MSPEQVSQLSLQSQAQFIKFCIQYASIALIYYDYSLTFLLEVRFMWRSKFRFTTLLYILTRYAMVANVLYLLAVSSKLSNCDLWYRVIGTLSALGRASVIFVFVARTYAIWNRDRLVLVALGILGLGCFVIDCLHIPGLKCHGPSGSQIHATLLSVLMCILELSVAVLTVCHALRTSKMKAFQSQDLLGFIMRQGVLYFCGAFIFTFTAMLLNFVAKPGSLFIKLLNALTLPLSCILTSRFLLHLRAYTTGQPEDSILHPDSTVSTLNFGINGMVEEFTHSSDTSDHGEETRGGNDDSECGSVGESERNTSEVWVKDNTSYDTTAASGSSSRVVQDDNQGSFV